MTNPAKAKGTAFESEILARLEYYFPDAHRTSPGTESQDITGTGGWIVECKHRRRWNLFDWIGKARARAVHLEDGPTARKNETHIVTVHDPWVIVAAHGDRRSKKGREVGTVAIIDFEVFLELLPTHTPKARN